MSQNDFLKSNNVSRLLRIKASRCIFESKPQQIHNKSDCYNQFIKQKKQLEEKLSKEPENIDVKNTLQKAEIDIQAKFIDSDNIKPDIPKSKIVKDLILNLFPLAIEKAVQGCRYINNIISNKVTKEGRCYHHYDKDEGAVKEAKCILGIERNLIGIYKKCLEYEEHDTSDMLSIFNNLAKEWYNVSILEPDKLGAELILIGKALEPLLS